MEETKMTEKRLCYGVTESLDVIDHREDRRRLDVGRVFVRVENRKADAS